MSPVPAEFHLRPAWLEIDLARLRNNLRLIRGELPAAVQFMAVVKDDAYGHGALEVAREALAAGTWGCSVSSLEEAMALREHGITAPILLLGERQENELPWCVEHGLIVCLNHARTLRPLARLAAALDHRLPVHVKINTGMNRYGVRWDEALPLLAQVAAEKSLLLHGLMTHFAQSEESDKNFAWVQISRFDGVLEQFARQNFPLPLQHLCNSGGFLDLPGAHRDLVRIGLLMHGIYPSLACRRIAGLEPVMSVKASIAAIHHLRAGESVGYGMRYTAPTDRRIAVIPIGYGDGFPMVRNQGSVLIHGRQAPIVGSVSMDALTVDVTEIPAAKMWDEAVIMGRQGDQNISAHDLARLKNSIVYDVLTGWRLRLRRKFINRASADPTELVHRPASFVGAERVR